MTIIKARQRPILDRCGAAASTLCAVHCFVCALFPALFGLLGLNALLGHEAEWLLVIVAISFALGALVFSWPRQNYAVIALLMLGIAGLLTSRAIEMTGEHDHGHHEHHEHHHESHPVSHHKDKHITSHNSAHTPHHKADARDKKDHHHANDGDHHAEPSPKKEKDIGHLFGALIGIFAGICLCAGHILNLRDIRRCKEC